MPTMFDTVLLNKGIFNHLKYPRPVLEIYYVYNTYVIVIEQLFT